MEISNLKKKWTDFEGNYPKETFAFILSAPILSAFPGLLLIMTAHAEEGFFIVNLLLSLLFLLLWTILPIILLLINPRLTGPVKAVWIVMTTISIVFWCVIFQRFGIYL